MIQDALGDLELIRAVEVRGHESVFELLENAGYNPDLPEDFPQILKDLRQWTRAYIF
jgi:hypothetical protein